MVALVIAFPVLVTGLLASPSKIDPGKVRIEIQAPDTGEIPTFQFGPPAARWRVRGAAGEVGDDRPGLGCPLSQQPAGRSRQRRALPRAGRCGAGPALGEVYRRLAAVEEAHAEFWRKELQRAASAPPALRAGLAHPVVGLAGAPLRPAIRAADA